MLDLSSEAGETDLALDFWLQEVGVFSSSTLELAVSGDGDTWHVVDATLNTALNEYTSFHYDLDAVLASQGIALDSDVYLRFTHDSSFYLYDVTLDDVQIVSEDLGDLNGDGLVNLGDVGPFVLAIVNPTAYGTLGFGVDADRVGDINSSGRFDLGDVVAFSQLFGPPVSSTTTAITSATFTATALAAPSATTTIVGDTVNDLATGQRDDTLLLALDGRLRNIAPDDNLAALVASDRREETSDSAATQWDDALLGVLDDILG